MSSEPNLHVYEYCGPRGREYVIATDAADAIMLLVFGEEMIGASEATNLNRLLGDKIIGLWCDEDGKPTERCSSEQAGAVRRVACSEWIALLGRGYVGTTES